MTRLSYMTKSLYIKHMLNPHFYRGLVLYTQKKVLYREKVKNAFSPLETYKEF